MKICSLGAGCFHADGRTAMRKLNSPFLLTRLKTHNCLVWENVELLNVERGGGTYVHRWVLKC